MDPAGATFVWRVRVSQWEPQRRPKPPLGPTALEVMRSCPLRACFEESPGYEPRLSFDARIGIAFHRTLEALNAYPGELPPGPVLAEWVRTRFAQELSAQRQEAAERPREQGLPRSEARQSAAAEALLEAAHLVARSDPAGRGGGGPGGAPAAGPVGAGAPVEVEVPVASANGLFRGRVDRAEHEAEGTRLLDFKSSLRDDLPERYERQLQLYAYMWRDTRGEWPRAAEVVYPLAGTSHGVSVEPEVCEAVAADGAELVEAVVQARRTADLARPGEVCQVCTFRPWCQPFWDAQSAPCAPLLAMERARYGMEGVLESLELKQHYVKAIIRWGVARAEVVAPNERFPHLASAAPGVRVRLLDAELRGMRHQPRPRITERTEIFLVE